MIQFQEIKFNNPGVLITDIPDDVWKILAESIEGQIKSKDYLKKLKTIKLAVAGIEETLRFYPPNEFLSFSEKFIFEYYRYFNQGNFKSLSFNHTFLNLQKKYEYRPVHTHNGDISFVVWYRCPYKMIDEDNFKNSYETDNMPNGKFYFYVNSLSGSPLTHYINTDQSYEGKMILFPSGLSHGVHAFFTSDEVRISLAGTVNIYK